MHSFIQKSQNLLARILLLTLQFLSNCSVIDVRSLTLVPKTTKGDDSSPANMTAAASIGQGSDRKRGFLRSRKSIKVPAVQAVTAPTAEDEASPRKDEAPVIRDQATRGMYSGCLSDRCIVLIEEARVSTFLLLSSLGYLLSYYFRID